MARAWSFPWALARTAPPLVAVCMTALLAWEGQPSARAAAASAQSIAVPAYFSPGSDWTRMDRANPPVRLAVVDPDNGPGPSRDPRYAAAVRAAQSAGITVVGYVFTAFAHRPLAAVEADVDAYYRWYGVNGVLFDQATTACASEPYYAVLNRYVKARGGVARTILNPGTQTNRCYAHAADILVTFEGSDREYLRSHPVPAWVAGYPPSHFWNIIYATSSATALARTIELSQRRRVGYVYVTGAGLPNPYGRLPGGAYWGDELADVAP